MATKADRVVIIDDQEDMRFLLGMIFDEAGYDAHLAEDGAKGLQLVSAQEPALIILDLKMPGLSGWGVVEQLKAARSQTPIILVSGAQDEITRGSLAPPVAGFLLKPFRVDEVLRMAQQALEAHRAEQAAADRRREPRRPLVMTGRLLGGDGQAIALGTIMNLSRGGTCFELGLPLQPGRTVRLALDVPGVEAPVALEGQIRWSKEGALGIQFHDLSPAQARELEALLDPGET
jgi:two-component system, response regulator, stage 0 sporulation protein F